MKAAKRNFALTTPAFGGVYRKNDYLQIPESRHQLRSRDLVTRPRHVRRQYIALVLAHTHTHNTHIHTHTYTHTQHTHAYIHIHTQADLENFADAADTSA